MTTVAADPWTAPNKARLEAALAGVRSHLEQHVSGNGAGPSAIRPPPADPVLFERPAAIDHVATVFGLSSFERDILVLCAGVELDGRIWRAVCTRPGRSGAGSRHLQPGAGERCRTPTGAPSPACAAPPLAARRARATGTRSTDEPAADRRAGAPLPGRASTGSTSGSRAISSRPRRSPRDSTPCRTRPARAPDRAAWAIARRDGMPPVIELCGADGPAQRARRRARSRSTLGLHLCAIRAEALPVDPRELDALLRLCEREAALSGTRPRPGLRRFERGQMRSADAAVTQFVDGSARRSSCSFGAGEPPRAAVRRCTLDVAKPTAARAARDSGEPRWASARERAWTAGSIGWCRSSTSESAAIARAVEAEGQVARRYGRGSRWRRLWDACRAQARPRLDDLAQRVDARAGWDDLVLPDGRSSALLREIAAQVRHRAAVYERWGFARHERRGLGIAALFAGASGTGKTMAAEVLAGDLRLDLYRIDLSAGRQQVHRRDREEPAAGVRRRRGRRRDPALRRGRRAVRQAQRGQGQPRPLRQHRGQLPAAADGGLPRAGHPDHQPQGALDPAFLRRHPLRGRTSRSPTRRSAPRSGGGPSRPPHRPTGSTSSGWHGSTWPAATSATSP